jgi:hypothetical protein
VVVPVPRHRARGVGARSGIDPPGARAGVSRARRSTEGAVAAGAAPLDRGAHRGVHHRPRGGDRGGQLRALRCGRRARAVRSIVADLRGGVGRDRHVAAGGGRADISPDASAPEAGMACRPPLELPRGDPRHRARLHGGERHRQRHLRLGDRHRLRSDVVLRRLPMAGSRQGGPDGAHPSAPTRHRGPDEQTAA